MEWVQTTGKSLPEAIELALDQLGVAEEDAEIEVLEAPRAGLFGRVRGEARVRARVRPTTPRPKADRRRRGAKRADGAGSAEGPEGDERAEADGRGAGDEQAVGEAPGAPVAEAAPPAVLPPGPPADREPPTEAAEATPRRGRSGGRRTSARGAGPAGAGEAAEKDAADAADAAAAGGTDRGDEPVGTAPASEAGGAGGAGDRRPARGKPRQRRASSDEASSNEQEDKAMAVDEDTAREFLEGLLEAFGLSGRIVTEHKDGDVELHVEGDDLGLLIGPRGQTLSAVQDLTRMVIERDPAGGRLRVDIGGYRRKRREALERFSRQIAEEVLSTGTRRVLEPMGSIDRKVVHDTVQAIDGVRSISEGEEPHRRVVILPDSE